MYSSQNNNIDCLIQEPSNINAEKVTSNVIKIRSHTLVVTSYVQTKSHDFINKLEHGEKRLSPVDDGF